MAPMSFALAIFLPQFGVAIPSPTYDLVGHGSCQDSKHESYEYWYAAGWDLPNLIYKNDASECICPECEELCNQNDLCKGYDFLCCPENVRCSGGASVLFSRGTRPIDQPPSPFSVVGPRGSETSGEYFKGEGDIVNILHNETGASCYRKPSAPAPPAPAPASGNCCWGASSCDSASNCHADAFCGASEEQCAGVCGGVWCPQFAALV